MPETIPILSANRWIEFKTSGRTSPALVACDLPGGGEVECVVKLRGHKEWAPHQPICEIVASLLAMDLGLPVAEPMLVEITSNFARMGIPANRPDARSRCENALGLSFASKHLPAGFSLNPAGKPPTPKLLQSFADLYAFDGLIQNADRAPHNPNCLIKGDELGIIDHDQAFGFMLDIMGVQPTGNVESYSFLRQHLAHPFLKRERSLFERLESAWAGITPAQISFYKELIPDEWDGKGTYLPVIESYLNDLHSNLASAIDAVTLTLPHPS